MVTNLIYFYFLFFGIICSAFGIIFAPMMYLSAISLFLFVCFSSLIYLYLNSVYLSVFQFILCGLFLSVYIFLLIKKIGRINLRFGLAPFSKILVSSVFVLLFGGLFVLYFFQEFDSSLYSFFNAVVEKSFDTVNFRHYLYPLSLVGVFVLVSAVVLRVFLDNSLSVEQPKEQEENKL